MFYSCYRGHHRARLLVIGDAPLEQVELLNSGEQFDLSPEQQALADLACRQMRAAGRTVTCDPTYRLNSYEVGAKLRITVSVGDYCQMVGVKAHPEWGLKCQTLAVCCALETPGGLVVERRSAKVASMPGYLHLAPAGIMAPPNTPLSTVVHEGLEELGLQPNELLDLRCTGLLCGEDNGVYQIICSARTELELSELYRRPRSGQWEVEEHLLAPLEPQPLASWIEENRGQMTPAALTALAAEGHRRWGTSWLEAQCPES